MTPEQVCELIYERSARDDETVNSLSPVLGEIMEWLFNGDMESITRFYEIADVTRMKLVYLAGVIRAAFGHGHQISTWNNYRLRAIEEAKVRFPNRYKGAFIGLINYSPAEDISETSGAFDRLIGIHSTFVRENTQ